MNNGISAAFYQEGEVKISDDYPYHWLRKNIQQFLSIRDFFAGDYYCLLEAKPWDNTSWSAFEYMLPEKGSGIITVFRPRNNPVVECCLTPSGLEADKIYNVGDIDGLLKTFSATGAELMKNGINIRLEKDYSSAVITLNERSGR